MSNVAIGAETCDNFVYDLNNFKDMRQRYGSLEDRPSTHRFIQDLAGARRECLISAAPIFRRMGENVSLPNDVENLGDDEFQNLPIKKVLDSLYENGQPMFQANAITKGNFHDMLLQAAEKIVTAVTTDNPDKVPYIREENGAYSAITPAFDPAAASARPPFYKRWFQGIVPRWKEEVTKYNTELKNKERSEKLEKRVAETVSDNTRNQNAPSRNENANTDNPSRRRTNLNELGGAQMSQRRQDSPARTNSNTREPLSKQAQTKQAPPRGRH